MTTRASTASKEAEQVAADYYAEQRERFPPDRGPWQGGAELRETVTEPIDISGSLGV